MQAVDVDAFWNDLAKVADDTYIPQSLADNKAHVSTIFTALVYLFEKKVCHGDIKPPNVLWDAEKGYYKIADLGSSKLITDIFKQMNRKFRFKSEAEKASLAPVIRAFAAHNEAQVQKFSESSPQKIERLVELKVLNKKAVPDEKKLALITDYIKSTFLPGTTKIYACQRYLDVMCDAFWQCDEKLFEAACNALDMRATALTAYRIITSNPLPSEDGPGYDKLESALRAQNIGKEAANIIRRMAEPKSDEKFSLPVSIKEIKKLITLLR